MDTTCPDFLAAAPPFSAPAEAGPYRLADDLKLPDEPRVELIHGRYYVWPSPITLHQVVSMELSFWLYSIAKRAGGRALAAPCDVVLADDSIVQPDLIYFTSGRRPAVAARIESPPDLVIEILSPSRRAFDRVPKAALDAEHGIVEYWIVDPAEQSFEFFVLIDGKYQLQPVNPTYQSPTAAELEIDLAAFWIEVDRQTEPSA